MLIKLRVTRAGKEWVKWSQKTGHDFEFCNFEDAEIFDTLSYDVAGYIADQIVKEHPKVKEIFFTRVKRSGGVDLRGKYELLLWKSEHIGQIPYRIPDKEIYR